MFRGNPSYPTMISRQPRQPQLEGYGDQVFLPNAASSSVAAATKQQPTYTTVGSIYNPKAAPPLQPPTRRPRTRRYPQPIRSPADGVFLPFPESLLAALPLKDDAPPSPPDTASVLQQYCPLQQNDDRAVGPVAETPELPFPDYAMGVPNDPALPSLSAPAGFDANDASDSVASEDALRSRITVKGITSLASYPNPVQKAAQNTLARARAADLDLSRPETPSSLPSATSELLRDRGGVSYGTAAPITGPPRPLMAGPPGQRPFKSSTLDLSSRILRYEGQAPSNSAVHQSRLPIGVTASFDTDYRTPVDDDNGFANLRRPTPLPREERLRGPGSPTVPEPPGTGRHSTPAHFDGASAPPAVTTRKVYDTLPPERIKQYYPNGVPSNYDGKHTPIREDWHARYPIAETQPGPERVAEREAKMNQIFYSGVHGWAWNSEPSVPGCLPHSSENNVGVIGGERARLRGNHVDRLGGDGRVQHPQLSPEDVAGMDEADAAEPLVRMALARLTSYKEASDSQASTEKSWPNSSWPTGFIKADNSWLEILDDGDKSYFSKLQDDSLKKKKALKKPRRGY